MVNTMTVMLACLSRVETDFTVGYWSHPRMYTSTYGSKCLTITYDGIGSKMTCCLHRVRDFICSLANYSINFCKKFTMLSEMASQEGKEP